MKAQTRTSTEAFGSQLSRARIQAGLSQAALGARLGLTNKTICLWEKGHQWPHVRVLADLFDALDVGELQRLLWIEMLRR